MRFVNKEKEMYVVCLSSLDCVSEIIQQSWIVSNTKDIKLQQFSNDKMLCYPSSFLCNVPSAGVYLHWIWNTGCAAKAAVILVGFFLFDLLLFSSLPIFSASEINAVSFHAPCVRQT